jgi:DNA-binding LytR/AlgR family response regulator
MQGSYVQFHLKYGNRLIPGHLNGWIQKLPEDTFIRISDTLIVPASELSKIQNNEYVFKGRSIKLTYRFAIAARREMERMEDRTI